MAKVEMDAKDIIKKRAKVPQGGSSAIVYLPKEWDGRELTIVWEGKDEESAEERESAERNGGDE